jgi:hypothetical protein
MSRLNIGVGDEFPLNEASGPESYPCGRMRAHWRARREARRERWLAWCAFWHGAPATGKAPAPAGDASYTDVPPSPADKKD